MRVLKALLREKGQGEDSRTRAEQSTRGSPGVGHFPSRPRLGKAGGVAPCVPAWSCLSLPPLTSVFKSSGPFQISITERERA